MKRARKFLVFFLSCVLALPLATLAPITANAEEGDGAVFLECGDFWSAHTQGYEITEEVHTYAFRSKTNQGYTANSQTPFFVVFHSGDGKVGGPDYKEYGVMRSDNFSWDGPGSVAPISKASEVFPEGFEWVVWQEANRNGVDCMVTTQMCNGKALIGVANNGIVTTYVVSVDATVTNYLSLSGEQCILSNLQMSDQHIDLSAAKNIANPEPVNPEPDEPEPDEPEPDEPGTDIPSDVFLECGDFWSAHTQGFEIAEEVHTYAFRSKTNQGCTENYQTPCFVVFHSGDGKVGGPDYKEYAVMRSDNFSWDSPGSVAPISKASEAFPEGFDWAVWQEANRAGVDCTVTTQMCNGKALIGVANNGVVTTYVVPVDSTVTNYLSMSGEKCTLSNLQTSDQHIDLSAAKNIADSGPDEPEPDTPGGDFLDCNEFWSAHTAGFEITADPHTYMFHTKTDEGKTDNWHTPLFVVFHSEDGKVDGPGYQEYGVIRSDNYHWDGIGTVGAICKATETFPEGFDWAAWQAANRNGVDCTVTTQMYNDCALIGVSNNGVVSTYAVPVNQAVANYVSLTGEFCVLSNLQTVDQHIDLSAARNSADNRHNASNNPPSEPAAPAAPAAPPSEVTAVAGGEVLSGSAWWTGMAIGSNQPMSGDGTWTWVVQASSLMDGYGAFSVEIYDPATNGYITTGSDMNAWTAEGFNPAGATITGIPAELASNLVEGHVYAVTVTRSGNTFAVQYVDYTENREICNLTITPGEAVSRDVQIHVMAQVGTYTTTFSAGTAADALSATKKSAGGEILKGTEWWTGMMRGTDRSMSGDGTWTWTVRASSLVDGYGAFSVEIYDPATNGYITTGSDKNAWTAEGFDPASASISGIPSQLDSKLVEGHTYAVTVTRSGNTFTVRYVDHTTGNELCNLVITPGETVGKDVKIHVMAQVGTFSTAFNAGTLIAALGDSVPVLLYVMLLVGIAAILYGFKKRFEK